MKMVVVRVLFVACAVALLLPGSLRADTVLDGSSQLITVKSNSCGTNCVDFSVTFANPVGGNTSVPGGSYSFNSVGPLTFSNCSEIGGCTTNSGSIGTFTLDGSLYNNLAWAVLDGDGAHHITFDFTYGSGGIGFFDLSNPTTFDYLYQHVGQSVSSVISSGEAPEPMTFTLLLIVIGAGVLLLRKGVVSA